MATYKVIQDIEADDKLLGPLTLRQFVYAGAALFLVYMSYLLAARGAAFLLIITIPPALIAIFFAFPWGREQPTEVWALARVRFFVKPRKRIWDQTGVKELVTITAPKRVEKIYTDGLSQNEVKSRLQALATTIDSRGWAIKNTDMSPYSPANVIAAGDSSERLIDPSTLPQSVPADDATIYDDVLDPNNNPKAQQFDNMLAQNAQEQRQRLLTQMQQQPTPPQPASIQGNAPTLVDPQQPYREQSPSAFARNNGNDEQALIEELRSHEEDQQLQYSHLPTILPLAEQEKQAKATADHGNPLFNPGLTVSASSNASQATVQPVTPEPDTAILELATKDDWNISTIARQAKKAHGEEPDEVVISLH